jgi:hypothetical protein
MLASERAEQRCERSLQPKFQKLETASFAARLG